MRRLPRRGVTSCRSILCGYLAAITQLLRCPGKRSMHGRSRRSSANSFDDKEKKISGQLSFDSYQLSFDHRLDETVTIRITNQFLTVIRVLTRALPSVAFRRHLSTSNFFRKKVPPSRV